MDACRRGQHLAFARENTRTKEDTRVSKVSKVSTVYDLADGSHKPERLLGDVSEACALLGVRRTFLFGLLASGQLPSCKLGRLRKIARADLECFVERLRAEAGVERWG
jgi:excisionase family DNA binding protein